MGTRPPPLLLLLLPVLLRPAGAETAPGDCAVPPPLLLASQVAEVARTALAAGSGGGQSAPGQEPPAGRSDTSEGSVLGRLEALERAVRRLTDGTAGPGAPADRPPSAPATCLQLQRANGSLADGVYQLAGLAEPVYCDFSHDGGGWTLLLTAASRAGWDRLNVRLRSADRPSLTDNYSILGRGDRLKAFGTGHRFAYRLEGQAQVDRRQWGGIWLAPRDYTFTPETDTQRDIALVKKFDSWTYGKPSLQKTMPWINVEDYLKGIPLLTTTLKASNDWWGTLLTDPATTSYQHSPWIHVGAPQSGTVLYWMREEVLP